LTAAGRLSVETAPGQLALFVVLTLASGSLPVASAWLTKLVIDGLVRGSPPGSLVALAAALAGLGVVTAVSPALTRYLRAEMSRRSSLAAQDRLFSAVDRFVGLARFENPHFLDRLRLAERSGSVAPNQAVDGVLGVVRSTVTASGFLGSLLVLSPVMAALVVAAAVPALLSELVLARRRAQMYWGLGPVERREIFYGRLLSGVEAAKEIRLFGIGAFLRQRMLAERRTGNAAKRSMDRREVRIQTGLGLLTAVVSGGGLMWTVGAAATGQLSPGDFTVFLAAVVGVQGVLASMAVQVAQTHEALLLFDHYLAVLKAGPDIPVPAAPRALPPLREGIELDDVWFRYDDDHPWLLRGLTLRIPAGQAMGIVGLNGAGKSTLVKLLCRFYDPTRGSIRWDGVDIREVDPAQLRRRIAAVFQDYMHYDLTARENIAVGHLDALGDTDRIHTAAKRTGIHDVLAGLPRGYDTLLSRAFLMESDKTNADTGVVLSGGQWQRVALARAFLRDRRDLMILDEPSAGLDAEAEHDVHSSLQRYRRGQTSLLISHRLGAVRDADAIVVIAGGQAVEHGDHATLMAAGGEYARLFELQASGYRAEATARPATGFGDDPMTRRRARGDQRIRATPP
jgi:ATP-binding cassette subfamily B protein